MARAHRNDVATRAGVAPSTVSNVLNGRAQALGIKPETAERVRLAAQDLGYIPNAAARALRAGHPQTLGLMLGRLPLRLQAPVLVEVLTSAIAQAQQRQHFVLPFVDPGDEGTNIEYVDRMLSDVSLAGVIGEISPRNLVAGARLHSLDVPVVWMSLEAPTVFPPGLAHVVIRQAPGVEAIMSRLRMEPGEEVAVLVGPGSRPERIDAALRTLGRTVHVLETETWQAPAGAESLATIRKAHPRARTIFCADDQLAVGVLHAMHESGLSAPEDYSVVGFGGYENPGLMGQRITSVYWPLRELTEAAVTILVDHLTSVDRLRMTSKARVVKYLDTTPVIGTTARLLD